MAKKRSLTPGTHDPVAADEAHVFRAAVRDVKPLSHVAVKALARPKPRMRARRSGPHDDIETTMPLIAVPLDQARDSSAGTAPSPPGLTAGDALSFQRPGVRTQVVRRLRRGLIPIDDELDLHGLTQTAARDQLADFLAQSRALGRRCVRIIHGKGYRSGARGPVLKVAVDTWLRRHFDVMAFTSARALDGGTGAVYVLLRA